MKELLIEFRSTSKRKPGKILYYRDGVSQGQFIQTLTEEIAGIQAACKVRCRLSPELCFVLSHLKFKVINLMNNLTDIATSAFKF